MGEVRTPKVNFLMYVKPIMHRFLCSPMHSRHIRLPTTDAPLVALRRMTYGVQLHDPEFAALYGFDTTVTIVLIGQPGCLAIIYPVVQAAGPGESVNSAGLELVFAEVGGQSTDQTCQQQTCNNWPPPPSVTLRRSWLPNREQDG